MSDQQQPPAERPVVNGVVALVAVALGVGLVLALVALVGTKVLGLGSRPSGRPEPADVV